MPSTKKRATKRSNNNITLAESAGGEFVRDGSVRHPTTAEEIIALLRAKGKTLGTHNAFRFEGRDNVGPETYDGDPSGYLEYVETWAKAQEETTEFTEQFDCLFGDGAAAVGRVANEYFGGFTGVRTLFTLPEMVTIKTGPGTKDSILVPSGLIKIAVLDAQLYIASDQGRLTISVTCSKAKEPVVRGLLELIRDEVKTNSIYRGKSLEVNDDMTIKFLNITDTDPEAIFYNDHTLAALKAHVWTMIEQPDRVRAAGLKLKSNVLLHGPYGTGKSLAAMLTARVANSCEWTYLQVQHGQDLDHAMDVALLLAPSVIVVEDIDTRISSDGVASAKLMELLDGTQTKGKSVIGLLTTNHPEKLQAGQWRKGRIDEQICIDKLDRDKMKGLTQYLLGEFDAVSDWDKVLDEMEGLVPAYVSGIVRGATLYQISARHEKIETDDLLYAVKQAREQLAFQEAAKAYTEEESDTLDAWFRQTIEEVMGDVEHEAKYAKQNATAAYDAANGAQNMSKQAKTSAGSAAAAAKQARDIAEKMSQQVKEIHEATV